MSKRFTELAPLGERETQHIRWHPRFPGSAEGLKAALFAVGRSAGLFRIARDSRWRSARLLILCYHGVSQADEHLGARELYVPAELFRRRMTRLREGGYRVLSLTEGLDRLATGTLPSRAVTVTFDDGFVDFSRVAYPILKDFGFPATVYVSTQYVQHQFPAFPPILGYILWRAHGREGDGWRLIGDRLPLRTATASDRLASFKRLSAALGDFLRMAPAERDDFAARVAQVFEVDYDSIKRQRLFHLMTEQELAGLDRRLVDIQLHTHHHVQPHERRLFHREIEENRRCLEVTGVPGSTLHHYCYPSGEVRPELPGWLQEQGVQSATTCVPGIVSSACDWLRLPRFIDTQDVSPLKFEAWLCGAAALLPQRG